MQFHGGVKWTWCEHTGPLRSALCSVVSVCSQVIFSFQALILVKMILLKAVRLDQDLMVLFLALSPGRQHRSRNKASVTDESGLQNGWRTSPAGQSKNGFFSVVSSTFYPLREALKSLTSLPPLSFFTSAHSSIVSLSTF